MSECGNPELLTPEELAEVVRRLPDFRAWLNQVEAAAMDLAKDNKLPGYKIVAGRSLRKWVDEDKAISSLYAAGLELDSLFEKKFVSVATAEKMVGKAAFREVEERLVYRTEGRPVLAPLSDKRAAINAAAEFETVKQET